MSVCVRIPFNYKLMNGLLTNLFFQCFLMIVKFIWSILYAGLHDAHVC